MPQGVKENTSIMGIKREMHLYVNLMKVPDMENTIIQYWG